MVKIKNIYILNNFKFVVITKSIMNIDKFNEYIIISVWSGNRKCVEITINKDDPKNASLDRFDYQKDCNISKDMKRKIDTHKMMDTLIFFLKNVFCSFSGDSIKFGTIKRNALIFLLYNTFNACKLFLIPSSKVISNKGLLILFKLPL